MNLRWTPAPPGALWGLYFDSLEFTIRLELQIFPRRFVTERHKADSFGASA